MKKFFYYLLGLLAVASIALGWTLFVRTHIPLLFLVATALALAFALWFLLRRFWIWLIPLSSSVLRLSIHTLVFGLIACAGILAVNFFAASDNGIEMEGEIVNKYMEEHTRYRRVGRRNIANGTVQSYRIKVMLPDSSSVEQTVTAESYRRLRIGQRRMLTKRVGALGFEVIDF